MVWCNHSVTWKSHSWITLLNLFVNDLFLFIKQPHVCNFLDNNILISYNENLSVTFQHLVFDLKNVLHRFRINSWKADSTKYQFMVLERSLLSYFYVLNIDGMKTTSTNEIISLGVYIDNKLTFKNHNDELYRRVSYQFHALFLIRIFLTKEKYRLPVNAFINCRFLYWPMHFKIWLNYSNNIQLMDTLKGWQL